jgi:hypothetical protein
MGDHQKSFDYTKLWVLSGLYQDMDRLVKEQTYHLDLATEAKRELDDIQARHADLQKPKTRSMTIQKDANGRPAGICGDERPGRLADIAFLVGFDDKCEKVEKRIVHELLAAELIVQKIIKLRSAIDPVQAAKTERELMAAVSSSGYTLESTVIKPTRKELKTIKSDEEARADAERRCRRRWPGTYFGGRAWI